MNIEKNFSIHFTGLKNGKHTFEFKVDNSFFENYNYDDFNNINADITVLLDKKSTLLELNIAVNGIANVPCDVTNVDFDLPIEGNIDIIVKFGEEYNDDHDEILIIPFSEHQVNVAQYIYEIIALAIPQKRVHPGVLDGTLDSEALDILGYRGTYDQEIDDLFEDDDLFDDLDLDDIDEEEEIEEDIKDNDNIDPRWSELKKLLTDK
ncbi:MULTISPECIES: YceD family protein [unclassified Myroides]|uniref:YceD family protein n=1 Tax=unclassified Myroides TaxID=2642485 RepID=UPI0031018BBB